MFNLIQEHNVSYGNACVCLSTDEKVEDGFGNGDVLIEMDTGDVYFFNEEGEAESKWTKF